MIYDDCIKPVIVNTYGDERLDPEIEKQIMESIPLLGPEHPQLASRNLIPFMLNNMGLTGEAVEIGAYGGGYSYKVLASSKLKRLYSIDPWTHFPDDEYVDSANVSQAEQNKRYVTTVHNLSVFGTRSVVLRMLSEEACKLFREESLDFIYIDGNHSYEGCKADIESWWPLLKKGGVFAGHDYLDGFINNSSFGVKSAVNEFVEANALKLYVTQAFTEWETQWPSWYLFK